MRPGLGNQAREGSPGNQGGKSRVSSHGGLFVKVRTSLGKPNWGISCMSHITCVSTSFSISARASALSGVIFLTVSKRFQKGDTKERRGKVPTRAGRRCHGHRTGEVRSSDWSQLHVSPCPVSSLSSIPLVEASKPTTFRFFDDFGDFQ